MSPVALSRDVLEALPPELDEAGKYSMRESAAARPPTLQSFGHMSDEWVADRALMLVRGEIWHHAICSAARDRIMRLSLRVAELEAQQPSPPPVMHANCGSGCYMRRLADIATTAKEGDTL